MALIFGLLTIVAGGVLSWFLHTQMGMTSPPLFWFLGALTICAAALAAIVGERRR